MTESEIAEYKEISKAMFDELCDTDSLIHINIEELTMQAMIKQFLKTRATKTDFGVMVGLLEFWNRETSTINFDSYIDYRVVTKSSLANANLARALKNLVEHEFIRKVETHNKLEYSFELPFTILKSEIAGG